ncbi:MAG: hypothetical protein GF344_02100 [Chitinivibrionales bacterium]|nr:hypothetical protein [Chitinivibrionales bacterium]
MGRHSVGVNPTVGALNLVDERHFRVGVTYNYSSKGTFRGFWMSPRLSLFYAVLEPGEDNSEQALLTLDPALGLGYRWVEKERLYLAIGGGAGPSIELKRDERMEKVEAYFFSLTEIGIMF